MRNRQSAPSGMYNSVTVSSLGTSGRRTGGTQGTSYMPNVPVRRTWWSGFSLPNDEEGLPSLTDGRRYLLSWGTAGILVATLLGLLWAKFVNAKAVSLQSFPWVMWWIVVFSFLLFAVWNIWYLQHWVNLQQREKEMVLQEKRSREVPKERMFGQLLAAASNGHPDHTAARVNAILRLADFVVTRGSDNAYFRAVGSGLVGTILMEIHALEREVGLDRNTRMVKQAATQALLAIKEHLQGVALQHVNLSGLALPLANLAGADLSSSRLMDTNLGEANLQGTNLENSDLQKANLQGAQLQGAILREAVCFEANLSGSRMKGVHAQGVNLQQANLKSVDLADADLRDANLQGVNLQEASLRFADLRGASLRGANLLHADLEGADLAGADLVGADLQGARTQGANLPS